MAKDRTNDDRMNEPLMGYPEHQLGVLGLPLPKQPDYFATVMALLSAGPKFVPETKKMARAIAAQGRGSDTEIAHLTPGEMVIPKRLQTPEVLAALKRAAGGAIDRYTVGHPRNRVNPKTGAPEFDDDWDKTGGGYADEGASGNASGDFMGYGYLGNSGDGGAVGAGDGVIWGENGLLQPNAPNSDDPGVQLALSDSLQRRFISPDMQANMKDFLATTTNGDLTPAQIDSLYSQIVGSLGWQDALTLGGIDSSGDTVTLTPHQMDIIQRQIKNLSPDLRDAAQKYFDAARSGGKVMCPKCGR